MEGDGPTAETRRVTRDVAPADLRDLVDRPPRATVAFVEHDAVDLLPARAECSLDDHRFGVTAAAAPDLDGREVVLVLDDGPYWFELRGVSVRGTARRSAADAGRVADGLVWYRIEARRVLAWDYGRLREE